MRMKQGIFITYILLIIIGLGNSLMAQIQVFESERSDSTRYSNTLIQDSIFIVYKGQNNRSTITLFADYNGVDSLNFEWYKFNNESKNFVFLTNTEWAKTDTLIFDSPNLLMDTVAGGYRVRVHNEAKGIDTTFTAWVWYQSFSIRVINIVSSTCDRLSLEADYDFDVNYEYYDLSVSAMDELQLTNAVKFEWTIDPGTEQDNRTGARPEFDAPFESTLYNLVATDNYNFVREKVLNIDESTTDRFDFPIMIATMASYKGFNGKDTVEFSDGEEIAQINVEAPHGVWFSNLSENGVSFEWAFYNHIDWRSSIDDTLLVDVINLFEPGDSIYYQRPKRKFESPDGYDVRLTSWGPEYNDFGERCWDTARAEFVIVDSTQFPKTFEQLPNVFTPNGDGNNDWFYFSQSKESDEKPVKSIKYFSIKIYNRWGNKVYDYEDDDGSWHESGKDQPGWDGTTRAGTKVRPGVYYYAIIAEGWNGAEFQENLGGYVHVFY